ncbi:MAG: hypothetical protein HYS57_00400 [Parcubacteria group bacterium]|nr:hypothetical protein [Parcubacteria group bacterium]
MKHGLVTLLVLFLLAPYAWGNRTEPNDECTPKIVTTKNLQAHIFNVTHYQLTPYYWKGGVTIGRARRDLSRRGIAPLAITLGGFNTRRSPLEPVDLVEIKGEMIRDRNELWPILFESENNSDTPYLDIVHMRLQLPSGRRWALASGPWAEIVDKNHKGQPIPPVVEIFGNEIKNELFKNPRFDSAWIVLSYPNLKLVKRKRSWDSVELRLVYDTTERRAIFVGKNGTCFAVVSGQSNAFGLVKFMVALKFRQLIMMDGGSSTLPNAVNPVYLAVTKR